MKDTSMQAYQLAYMAGAAGADLVLSTKNIFGMRYHGRISPNRIIWNNCGQYVISGGGVDATDPGPTQGAQREYFEETGVDFRVPAVRVQMRCIGDPVLKVFKPDPQGFCCVYQMVSNQSPLVATANANIGANLPADEELHDCGLVAAGNAVPIFGPPQLAGWRLAQYQQLTQAERARANQHMADPFDWFVRAVEHLVGEIAVTPQAV